MKRSLMALAVLTCSSTVLAGDLFTGNSLLVKCKTFIAVSENKVSGTRDEAKDVNLCVGWVAGASSGLMLAADVAKDLGKEPKACLPGGALTTQIARVFVKWMEDHPERLHSPAFPLFVDAIIEAFPCEAIPK